MGKKCLLFFLFASAAIAVYGRQNYQTENVFLITLDGLRWQELYTGIDSLLMNHGEYVHDAEELRELYWDEDPAVRRQKLMPFFWSVIHEKGQLYGNREYQNRVDVSNNQVFSYPGYNELLTGYVDEGIDSNDKIWNPNTTVLEFINLQPGFEGKVAAFGSWDVFSYIINSRRSGIPVNAGFQKAEGENLTQREQFLNELQGQIPGPWSAVRLDAFTHHYALEYVKREQPRLLYIAYGETDDFAHDGNYQAYIRSANQTDAFIKELWAYTQSHPAYRGKTTFIITTDHGRGTRPVDQWRHHGVDTEGAREIWIGAIGPDTSALGEIKEEMQLYQNQIAKTVAWMLGLHYKNEERAGAVIESITNE